MDKLRMNDYIISTDKNGKFHKCKPCRGKGAIYESIKITCKYCYGSGYENTEFATDD